MAGQSYSKMRPGDPCWLAVKAAPYPPGFWRGDVVTIKERDGGWKGPWFEVTAQIIDGRIKDHRDPNVRALFNRKPTVSYVVVPSTKEFDGLVRRINNLEEGLRQQIAESTASERSVLEVIKAIKQAGG